MLFPIQANRSGPDTRPPCVQVPLRRSKILVASKLLSDNRVAGVFKRARHELVADGVPDSKTIVGFRAAYVFDVAQTDGAPLPEPAEAAGDPGIRTAGLRAAIAAQGITVDYVQELDGALGSSSGGRIQVLMGLPLLGGHPKP